MTSEEIQKLTLFFKKKFSNLDLSVKKRPKKEDSAEVYLGDEFLGVLYRDEEEGEISYNFQMAILELDLE